MSGFTYVQAARYYIPRVPRLRVAVEERMRRRDFIGLAGGAAVAPLCGLSPVAAQPPVMPVIGYLGPESPAVFASRLRAFRQGLAEVGYSEGHNVAIEFRWAEGRHSRLPALAAELVARQVNVIVAPGGAPSGLAAKSATSTVPIVFEMGADPVKLGLVSSLSRPDGNITGIASLNVELSPKRLEILREILPAGSVVGVLVNPTSPTGAGQLRSLQAAAPTLELQLHIREAGTEQDLEPAFEAFRQVGAAGLVVTSDTFFATRSERLAALATRDRLPAIHQSRDFAVAGGLMSYGGSFMESHRQAGAYAGRIIKGDKPGDLPVQQVTKVELLINVRTAKAFGVTVPLPLIGRADDTVE